MDSESSSSYPRSLAAGCLWEESEASASAVDYADVRGPVVKVWRGGGGVG